MTRFAGASIHAFFMLRSCDGGRLGVMNSHAPAHDLRDQEDLHFQRIDWAMQRMGRWVLAAFLLVAASGLFGGMGPLAETSATDGSGDLRVEYPRFARVGAPATLLITTPADPVARIVISNEFLARVRVTSMVPRARQVQTGVTETAYEFSAAPGASSLTVRIDYVTDAPGSTPVTVSSANSGDIHFTTFAWP